jgi:hypothetical protein
MTEASSRAEDRDHDIQLTMQYAANVSSGFVSIDKPLAPGSAVGTVVSTSKIIWSWTDNSLFEDGFKVYADPGAGPPTTLCATTAVDVEYWAYTGLTANTQYCFQVAATNAVGDSGRTPNLSTYTTAQTAIPGYSVLCDRSIMVFYPVGTVLAFSNPMGFGTGTHGGSIHKISAFRYVWDTNPTCTFSGVEPVWSSGTLPITPPSAGEYYLHLQSLNAEDVPNPGTFDYGPFWIDADLSTPTPTPTQTPVPTPTPTPDPSDVNGNGVVDDLDLFLLMRSWYQSPTPFPADSPDVNGDGIVDELDLPPFMRSWHQSAE